MGWATFLGGLLLNLVGSFVGRIFLALGLSVVTYQGMELITGKLRALFEQYIYALPSDWVNMAGMLKIGTCFSILLSALAVKAAAAGVSSGSFKKWQLK